MNISILESTTPRRKKQPAFYPPPHSDMNYNHGYGGPGPGGPPQPQPYMDGQNYAPQYQQQQQQFDSYGNPVATYDNYQQQPHPSYPPQQQQHMYPDGGEYARRDVYDGNQAQQPYAPQNEERVLRNPHPHIPRGPGAQESYDPSLPTYNATPIYHQPQVQKPAIVAPSITSIFEIAAERVSKRMEQQQQQIAAPVSSSSRGHHQQPQESLRVAPPLQQQQQAPTTIPMMSAPSPSAITEIITGLVTQMQDMFGMVSGEVFFQTSTVVGNMPQVGDKVVVEAERVSGMPFKFNAKRVQMLSKDLISQNDCAPAKQQHHDLGFERRRGGDSDFGPLPTMPNSLNLTQTQTLRNEVSVTPPLKSILKRNPPPPPILSERRAAPAPQKQEKYRPESPVGFGTSSASFSIDMRRDFPVLKAPPKQIQDLYPELLYVKKPLQQQEETQRRVVESPPRRKRTRSRSPMARRRSSRSPRRRTRSKSPKRRSRSRSRDMKSSRRSPRLRSRRSRTRSISRSKIRRRRSRTPEGMKKTSDREQTSSKSRSSKCNNNNRDDDEVQILTSPQPEQDSGLGPNPFGKDSEIKAVIQTSSLFPRIKKPSDDDKYTYSAPTMSDFRNPPEISSRPARPLAPIRFQIQPQTQQLPPQPVPAPKMVPNPAFGSAVRPSGGMILNPNYRGAPLPQATINNTPGHKAIMAEIQKALKKGNKLKKKDEQEPAFKILGQPTPKNGNDNGSITNILETPEEQQIRRINELKNSLHEQKMAQIVEQERLLRDQKRALAAQMKEQGNPPQKKNVTQIVEEKLKGLRQNFEKQQVTNVAGDGKVVAVEKMREEIEFRQFVEKERRLKAAGDYIALQKLHQEEDCRRRRAEEERLERLRLEEMTLKKEKNWGALKKLRDTYGGTAEREVELMRLKEMRGKEEMEADERQRAIEEQEVHMRAVERSQRGQEGPVRRLVMETQIRQLNSAQIPVGHGHHRGSRSATPPPPRVAPQRERRRSRSRSRSRGREPGRSGDRRRSPERRSGHRTRSSSRDRRSRRSRSVERRGDRRSPVVELRREEEEMRQMQMREQLVVAQMEAYRRQEQDLLEREREIHHRMQMMQEHQQQQQQYLEPHPQDYDQGHPHYEEERYVERERRRY